MPADPESLTDDPESLTGDPEPMTDDSEPLTGDPEPMTDDRESLTNDPFAGDPVDRSLCGWRVSSEVPLDELLRWSGDDRAPELRIRRGAVPAGIGETRLTRLRLEVGDDGACRYERPGLATFLVRGGADVLVHAAPDVGPRRLAGLLLGPVLSIVCHQRGLVPLHACCFEIDGVAVAVAGPSGSGKSTLAAAFAHGGHPVLAEDLTVVDASDPAAAPLVLPSVPRLKLAADMLDALGVDPTGLERGVARADKYHLPIGEAFQTEPRRLAAVFHLGSPPNDDDPAVANALAASGVAQLRGTAAAAATASALYGPRLAVGVLGREEVFRRLSRLAGSEARSYRLDPTGGTDAGADHRWHRVRELIATVTGRATRP